MYYALCIKNTNLHIKDSDVFLCEIVNSKDASEVIAVKLFERRYWISKWFWKVVERNMKGLCWFEEKNHFVEDNITEVKPILICI